MLQLSGIDFRSPYEIASVLFVFLLLAFVAGNWLRKYKIKNNLTILVDESDTISTTLLGLLALILAFSFSMANARYDTRRSLAIDEANMIGTVILRSEVFPDSIQKGLKSNLKDYVEERIALSETGTNVELILFHLKKSEETAMMIWGKVTAYSKVNPELVRTSEIIPAINDMIDVATSRRAASEANIPDSIQWFLLILCVFSTFLLGYERKNKLDWIIVIGFSLVLSITVFSIFDLDRPRSGLVTLIEASSKIKDLRVLFE